MVLVGAELGESGNLVSAWLIQVLSWLSIELELGFSKSVSLGLARS